MLLIPKWMGILASYSRIAPALTVRKKNSRDSCDSCQRASLRFQHAPRYPSQLHRSPSSPRHVGEGRHHQKRG
jgi:hypothetical protein